MSSLGIPLTDLELMQKVELMRLQNDLRMQSLPPIPVQQASTTNVIDLIAAQNASDSALDSASNPPSPQETFNNWLQKLREQNPVVLGDGRSHTSDAADEGRDLWKNYETYGLPWDDMIEATMDPVGVVRGGFWPAGTQNWGYKERAA